MPVRLEPQNPPAGTSAYLSYVLQVEELATRSLLGEATVLPGDPHLNGRAARALSDLVDLRTRRESGAFFTTSKIRDGALQSALPKRPRQTAAFDPACGAGDLLLRWTSRLRVGPTLESTIRAWSAELHGTDIHESFVRLARARLVLAAAARVATVESPIALDSCFSGVRLADGVESLRALPVEGWTLMNPPFNSLKAPPWYSDGGGSISQAAVFSNAWLRGARSGSNLVAILPEVLRTGSRYASWRTAVERHSSVRRIQSLGQFDLQTDIDVFLLIARKTSSRRRTVQWWPPPPVAELALDRRPSVAVGTVVPHRDAETGPIRAFLTARNLPHVRECPPPSERRAFSGAVFRAPFVAVRRTSRPGQNPRARATTVTGSDLIAVENHLIVVKPTSGGLRTCNAIAQALGSSESSKWLDQRLGGRHITSQALSELVEGWTDE